MSDENLTPLDGEGTALEIANAAERRIQLEGREDPDKFKMPDGSTLTETRQKMYESQVKEGDESTKVNLERARELSIASDPLYAEGAKAVMSGTNATIIPAKNEEPQKTGGDLKTEESLPKEQPRANVPSMVENFRG